jgi:hypothetical protein
VIVLLLPNGISGFYNSKDNEPHFLKRNDVRREFYSAVNKLGGKIVNFKDVEYPQSFFEGEFKIKGKHIYALFNGQYPFMALASKVDYFNIEFIDEPDLSRAFTKYFRVLSVNELNTPLLVKQYEGKIKVLNKNQLNTAELDQILFWEPKTIGEVIFNFWD